MYAGDVTISALSTTDLALGAPDSNSAILSVSGPWLVTPFTQVQAPPLDSEALFNLDPPFPSLTFFST